MGARWHKLASGKSKQQLKCHTQHTWQLTLTSLPAKEMSLMVAAGKLLMVHVMPIRFSISTVMIQFRPQGLPGIKPQTIQNRDQMSMWTLFRAMTKGMSEQLHLEVVHGQSLCVSDFSSACHSNWHWLVQCTAVCAVRTWITAPFAAHQHAGHILPEQACLLKPSKISWMLM